MEFSYRLKELRESKGMTQKELADLLNDLITNSSSSKIYTQTVSYWENGREPSYEILIILSNIFDVSLDYLLGKSDCKNLEEVRFDYFSKFLSKKNIDDLVSKYPENIKKSIYTLLSTCLSVPLMEVKYNYTQKMHGKDIDWLFLVCKTLDILSMYFLDLKSCFYDDKSSCYFDMFEPRDIEELHNSVTKIMSKDNDSISKDTFIKFNKNKALAKMRLELIIEQFEQLGLYGSQSEILFKNEILEYVNTPDNALDRFSKLVKNDFITFADNVLSMRKYTDDSDSND